METFYLRLIGKLIYKIFNTMSSTYIYFKTNLNVHYISIMTKIGNLVLNNSQFSVERIVLTKILVNINTPVPLKNIILLLLIKFYIL
jgi:hypothetical protein